MAQDKSQKKGQMSVSDAGKRGGETTAKKHGKEFYEEIGRKGGEARGQQQQKDNK